MSPVRVHCMVLALVLPVGGASAQDSPAVTSSETPAVSVSPSYLEYRRNELAYLAKRSRIRLLSSSAVAAVGIAPAAPAAAQECVVKATSASFDEIRCTNAGKALMGVGAPLLIAGVTGVLVTAIMLGVRKGKIRNIDDQLAYERHRAVRWDPRRSAFAF